MDPIVAALLNQAPAVIIGLAVVIAFSRGLVRSAYEVDAWRQRAQRAEQQVDTLAPLVEQLAAKIDRLGGAR